MIVGFVQNVGASFMTQTTDASNRIVDEQLADLRSRLAQIRISKAWLQEFRVNAPERISSALSAYYNWLCEQEQKTISMGRRIKAGGDRR